MRASPAVPRADATSFAISCRLSHAGSVVLDVAGSIDIAARDTLLDAGTFGCLVSSSLEIDAEDVDFIDATGLGALIELTELARRQGVLVSLDRRSPSLRRLLALAGLPPEWPDTRAG